MCTRDANTKDKKGQILTVNVQNLIPAFVTCLNENIIIKRKHFNYYQRFIFHLVISSVIEVTIIKHQALTCPQREFGRLEQDTLHSDCQRPLRACRWSCLWFLSYLVIAQKTKK